MKTITPVLFAVLFLGQLNTNAQTGSFNKTIDFNDEGRTLSCYVPANYDSTRAYRLMICLHGLGDNSTNYRNGLISALNWPTFYPHTIFVCPDGGADANKDFYQPAGDEEIIPTAIQFAMGAYHIDSQSVLLQGFSLGGRSALKYGLEHTRLFKGLLLNTPAMQGLADVLNDSVGSLKFNYDNASLLPMFITVGGDDYAYFYQDHALAKMLKKHNAPLHFEAVPGMDHDIPNGSYTQKSFAFLVSGQRAHLDADLFAFEETNHFCSATVAPKCMIRNNGDSVIYNLTIAIASGNQSTTQSWDGTLLPNQYATIPLTISLSAGGQYAFSAKVTGINQSGSDEDSSNNQLQQFISVANAPGKSLVTQGFDWDTSSWVIRESGSLFTWTLDPDIKRSGKASMECFNTPLFFYTKNYVESFSSPFININTLTQKELHFDVAYNYLTYTPPYVITSTDFADTLEILISTDCGETYSGIYKKGGKELITAAEPLFNPLTITDCIFRPTDEEWRTETISLADYATVENAIFKFNYISAMGGSINIDNISLGGAFVGVNETKSVTSGISFYPNPANNQLVLSGIDAHPVTVSIYNASGRSMMSRLLEVNDHRLDISEIPSGLYFIHIGSGEKSFTQKLLIQH